LALVVRLLLRHLFPLLGRQEVRAIIPYLAPSLLLAVDLVTAVDHLLRVVLAGQVAAVVTPEQAALEIPQALRHLKEVTVEMARESRGQIMAVAVVVAHLQLAVTAATRLAAMAATAPRLAFLARL